MSLARSRIACIGGVDVDYKARVKTPAQRGTSNPVTVKSCTGGVAGNVARNLARLGCDVSLFSIVGRDAPGGAILREMMELGIDTASLLRSNEQATATYTAVLEPSGELFIGLANMEIFDELTPKWADGISSQLALRSIWILDANLPAVTIDRLLRIHKAGHVVLADPISTAKAEKFAGVLEYLDVVFPNEKEAEVLSGKSARNPTEIEAAAKEIILRGARQAVITLGEDGVYVDDGKARRFVSPIPPEQVRDVTGAGDALVAGYAYGMLQGGGMDPVMTALAAASIALETEESVSPEMSVERLRERMERI